MKIVIISTLDGYTWGGSEELWYHTALAAKELHQITICMLGNDGGQPQVKKLRENGVKVVFIGNQTYEKKSMFVTVYNKLVRKQPKIAIINRFLWIDDIKPDVVLVNASTAISLTLFPDLTDWLINTKYSFVTLIQHHFENGLLNNNYSQNLRSIFNRAKNNFIVANRNIEVLQRQMGHAVPNVRLVQNPINISNPQMIPYPLNNTLHIAVVARLDCNCKGQDILLETLSSKKWKTYNFHINFYGKGPDEDHLKELIEYYDVGDRVSLKGHVNDIQSIWVQNHILMLPSLSEGTPISLVEAICCGRAAIVTDVGDNARLVQDGVTGFVAPTASVMALTRVLERALNEHNRWQKMGELALELTGTTIESNPGKTLMRILIDEIQTGFLPSIR